MAQLLSHLQMDDNRLYRCYWTRSSARAWAGASRGFTDRCRRAHPRHLGQLAQRRERRRLGTDFDHLQVAHRDTAWMASKTVLIRRSMRQSDKP
jgi:hypothetical protein